VSESAASGGTTVTAQRLCDRPVVGFGAVAGYGPIFNAGVIVVDGVYHLFARGVRDCYRRNGGAGPRFVDYVSDLLVFTSEDGLDYRFQQVLATGADEGAHSLEDPRVQRVRSGGGEEVMLTYTYLPAPESGRPWQVGVHRLVYEDGRFALNRSSGRVVGPHALPDKDAVIFNLRDGRVALIHRLHPDIQLAPFDSLEQLYDPEPGYWEAHLRELDRHTLIRPADGALGVGAGAPPVATDAGLLLFYHERRGDGHYTLKAALLDEETGGVLALLPEPLLEPELSWERRGDVDNVVFVQGAVLRGDGTVYLTYGAADRCIGAASIEAEPLLRALAAAA
jgi:beta-1,2-mannobiose phosphorylase / 1,2-beta-oligomannan phosphorylase